MTLVLDAGGLTALARDAARLRGLRDAREWPPTLPSVVLVESLTGDPRRDHAVNRLLRACVVAEVDERLAREAAQLRTATGRAAKISATDAVVAAYAARHPSAVVVTSDPHDLAALAEQVEGGLGLMRA